MTRSHLLWTQWSTRIQTKTKVIGNRQWANSSVKCNVRKAKIALKNKVIFLQIIGQTQ